MMYRIIPLLALFLLIGAGCNSASPTGTEDVDVAFGNATKDMQEETPMKEDSNEQEKTAEHPGVLPDEEIQNKQIRIQTEKGDIVFELYSDTAPLAVSNFVHLTNNGFYNGLTFHRREEGFVIQGGDPSGNGTGGPGYTFEDELADEYKYERGIVAMANRGPNTNGSQFFIMLDETPLPKAYTIFGRVTEGMDLVDGIQIGDTMTTVSVEDAS